MSYIPALSWSSQLRLTTLTKEPQWREKANKDIQAFVSGQTPAMAEPYRLTSMAGALAFADAASMNGDAAAGALAQKVAAFILPQKPDEVIRFATGWTDDMFMASAVLSRVDNGAHAAVVGQLLTSYAGEAATSRRSLHSRRRRAARVGPRQRLRAARRSPKRSPICPANWADRPRVLEIYRKHTKALAAHQSDDGSWRQVVDEPTSYRELTVTAMTSRRWRAASRAAGSITPRSIRSSTAVGPPSRRASTPMAPSRTSVRAPARDRRRSTTSIDLR